MEWGRLSERDGRASVGRDCGGVQVWGGMGEKGWRRGGIGRNRVGDWLDGILCEGAMESRWDRMGWEWDGTAWDGVGRGGVGRWGGVGWDGTGHAGMEWGVA